MFGGKGFRSLETIGNDPLQLGTQEYVNTQKNLLAIVASQPFYKTLVRTNRFVLMRTTGFVCLQFDIESAYMGDLAVRYRFKSSYRHYHHITRRP